MGVTERTKSSRERGDKRAGISDESKKIRNLKAGINIA
jgi:hypothetical protein